jgi:hypothetical protein
VDIDQVWDRIKKGLREGATMSMEKIEEYTKIGKLKIDELAARRKIDRNFADIGKCVFDLMEQGRAGETGSEPIVVKAVESVKALRVELSVIAGRIREVQEEARRMAAARHEGDEDPATGA